MTSGSNPLLLGGYRVLPMKVEESDHVVRNLFVKELSTRLEEESRPKGRTLFVSNVPPLVEELGLKKAFSFFGPIVQIIFRAKATETLPSEPRFKYFPEEEPVRTECYRVAYIVFKKEASLVKAMSIDLKEPLDLYSAEDASRAVGGPKKWAKDFKGRTVDVKLLESEIEEYLSEYDARIEEEKKRGKEMDNKPDEEGWITVSRHGKKAVLPDDQSFDQKVLARAEEKKRKKANAMGPQAGQFYSFQIREGKMNRLAELRLRFQEDKKRIALMKAARKFKPF